MKITKPSQLREGMRIDFLADDLHFWGWAKKSSRNEWRCVGGTGSTWFLGHNDERFPDVIGDVESVEGIRAAKEGDTFTQSDGDELKVVFCNEYCCTLSNAGNLNEILGTYTYEQLERWGYKLKGDYISMADIANAYQEINIREIQQAVFKEIEEELFKHKFSTDMDGWQIVPELTATMQILRSKYFKENQGA